MITQPEFFEDGAAAITPPFGAGLEILHLREPGASYEDINKPLRHLSTEHMECIITHDHFEPTSERSLKNVHLDRRNPAASAGFTGHVSRSCHSLEEVTEYKTACNYAFLNPICNSISKGGYAATYAFGDLQKARRTGIIDSGVVALGGVTAEYLPEINSLGFGGVGLLGDIWQRTGTGFINHFRELLHSVSVF